MTPPFLSKSFPHHGLQVTVRVSILNKDENDDDFDDDDFMDITENLPARLDLPGPSKSVNEPVTAKKTDSDLDRKITIVISDSDDEDSPVKEKSNDIEMKTAESLNDGFDSDDSLEKLFTDPTVCPTPKDSIPKRSSISNLRSPTQVSNDKAPTRDAPKPKSPTRLPQRAKSPTQICQAPKSPVPTCSKNDFELDFDDDFDDDFVIPEVKNDEFENEVESDGGASPIIGSSHPRVYPEKLSRVESDSDGEFDEDFPLDAVLNTGIIDPNDLDLQIEAGSLNNSIPSERTGETSEVSSKSGFLDTSAKCDESDEFDDGLSGEELYNLFLS